MSRYSDINPMDLDPDTGRPYSNYSSPSLDTSFHDGEMDVDDDCEEQDKGSCDNCGTPLDREAKCFVCDDEDDDWPGTDDPRALQAIGWA